ncbi:MAG: hypothetical protein RL711_1430 [Bacteroidota bacterium]|jgi:hypothetical protein
MSSKYKFQDQRKLYFVSFSPNGLRLQFVWRKS